MPLGGSPRANGNDNAMPASLPARAPSVRIATGGFRPSARAFSRRAAVRGLEMMRARFPSGSAGTPKAVKLFRLQRFFRRNQLGSNRILLDSCFRSFPNDVYFHKALFLTDPLILVNPSAASESSRLSETPAQSTAVTLTPVCLSGALLKPCPGEHSS
jgi:hypothetical protein